MKFFPKIILLFLAIFLFWQCKKKDEVLTTKANFEYTSEQANQNSGLFPGLGSTYYDNSTKSFIVTDAVASNVGGAYYKYKQDISIGFDVEFDFSITNMGGILDCNNDPGGDGLSFLLLAGEKLEVSGGGGLGYSGTKNCIAFEIDTWCNYELGDPNGNHVSIHSNGENANSTDENYSLGLAKSLPNMSDEKKHTLRISYNAKTLEIYLDSQKIMASKPGGFDISKVLKMTNNLVYMGITASTGSAYETHSLYRIKIKTL